MPTAHGERDPWDKKRAPIVLSGAGGGLVRHSTLLRHPVRWDSRDLEGPRPPSRRATQPRRCRMVTVRKFIRLSATLILCLNARKGGQPIVDDREGLLGAVRSPLGFFTLALLVVEGILLKLVAGVSGGNQAFLAVCAIFVLIIIIVAMLALVRPNILIPGSRSVNPDTAHGKPRYDVFISTPMFAFNNETRYRDHRSMILELIRSLREECQFECYYAGERRSGYGDFEVGDVALSNDLRALRDSKFYLLVIPEVTATSALVEAGAALILRKPSTYLVQRSGRLPFALQHAANSGERDLPRIKVYDYSDLADLQRLIRINKKELFI